MQHNIYLYYIKQNIELPIIQFEKLLHQLPVFLQQDILAYKHQQTAQASLLGKLLLQYALKKLYANFPLEDIKLGYKDRPYINNEIDFNISHSSKYVVCAITKNAKIGIDIEKHRKINVDLFQKYFDENEWHEIESSENKTQAFFNLWTIKESAIKCDGRGVEILGKTHKIYNSNNLQQVACDDALFYYQKIRIDSNYDCCVCSNNMFKNNIFKIELILNKKNNILVPIK